MTPSTSINGSVRKWRRYPAYKNPNVAWLGCVPVHWGIKQLKYAVTFQRGHDLPTDSRIDGDVPVVTSGGITARHNCSRAKGPGIVTGRYGTVGVFHYVEIDYWPHNTALYTIALHGNSPRYLWYMLQSLSELFLLNSAKSAVPGVDRNDLHPITVVVPTIGEQRAISGFLDRESTKIDALIAKKEQLIELLQEKRTALISHAVTKGLDPTVPMKDSGIEWVGKIPTHWTTKRAKFLFRQTSLPVREGDGVVTAFRDGQVTLRENRRTEGYTFAILELGYQGIRHGQLVLHSMDAFAGAIGVSESDGKCSPEYIICDPLSPDTIPDFYTVAEGEPIWCYDNASVE
jgi:type I restriction enzyme S subunit